MIKAILMDFNGVIIDDEQIQLNILRDLLTGEGIAITDGEYFASLGMDDRRFVEAAFERADKTPAANQVLDITQRKSQKWRETIAGNVPLFPGIENFIRKAARDFELGIVSMSKGDDIQYVLERTGLADLFSVIVSAENVTNCKPDPECYRKAFEEIDLVRIGKGHLPMMQSECIVIEDSPPGVTAGTRANLQVLGVCNTVTDDELRTAGATWVADDLNDWMPDSVRLAFGAKI